MLTCYKQTMINGYQCESADFLQEPDQSQYLIRLNHELSARVEQLENFLRVNNQEHSEEIRRLIDNSENTMSDLEERTIHLEQENRILQSSIMTYQQQIVELNREYFSMWSN